MGVALLAWGRIRPDDAVDGYGGVKVWDERGKVGQEM